MTDDTTLCKLSNVRSLAEEGSFLTVEHRLVPRWRDADSLGHVNHAVFLTYFEDTRDRWLDRAGILGINYAVATCTVDFEREIRLREEIRIRCTATRLGRTSITTAESISNSDGERIASARFVLVLWDPERRVPRPMTDDERRRLQDNPAKKESI